MNPGNFGQKNPAIIFNGFQNKVRLRNRYRNLDIRDFSKGFL